MWPVIFNIPEMDEGVIVLKKINYPKKMLEKNKNASDC